MFEFRLRVLDVRERETDIPSFLGIVEGFPQILVHAASAVEAERDLFAALGDYLTRIQDREATRIEWDEFPTVRESRLHLTIPLRLSGNQRVEGEPGVDILGPATSFATARALHFTIAVGPRRPTG